MDSIELRVAKALGLEYISEDDGGIGWDWYAQDEETGEKYATHAGKDQLEQIMDVIREIATEHLNDCLKHGVCSVLEGTKILMTPPINKSS